MTRFPQTAFTRRSLLAAGAAAGTGALLTACGGDGGPGGAGGESGGDGSGGGWTFTDDRGETVRLDARPERLVAYVGSAAALHDYGVRCTGVFGPTVLPDGSPDVQAARLDVEEVTVLGNTWGEFNVEAYAELQPQLLISGVHTPPDLWYVPEDSAEEILSLAPSVGIRTLGPGLATILTRYTELAEALGADLAAPAVTEARARFDAAAGAVRTAARDNGGLRVLVISATADQIWFAAPAALPDLTYFTELGVAFVSPDNPEDGGVFESASWENADRYPADLILVDNRTSNLQPADLQERKPTWRALPAVRAGQVASWTAEPTFSHTGVAPLLEDLADAVRTATRAA
ncbi:ABC transporter substrate-binding protein [Streptomyces sp. DSM 44917]|uniref:ABC transporter substrate-binding protein n=1 Tax=Streptomyces boetiae TaxID=3075541 RepID=A0ABU2LFC2_9ACTN|nr:ABC transporter substrate-binding protein [Streptomyces sp. DSM 44917]MDT0310276.1 ABC transporter substrate-binding protein [Streptomyces sp. DSM 44917]